MEILRHAARRYGKAVEIRIFGTNFQDAGFARLERDFDWSLAGILNPSQTATFLNETDIFVDFSRYQAMGLTALEAMACGAAVIVPARGGAGAFARDGENVLVADASTPGSCWQALQRLIEDHQLRSRLQDQALRVRVQLLPRAVCFAYSASLVLSAASSRRPGLG